MAKQNKKLAQVFHFDLQGKRDEKYDFLNENSLKSISWNELEPDEPNYFLVNKNFEGNNEYEKGINVNELFTVFASGLTTERDSITIQFDEKNINSIVTDFKLLDTEIIRNKYDCKPDGRDWKYSFAKNDLILNKGKVVAIAYRPFDYRKTFYTGKSKGFMAYPRNEIMQHLINGGNIGLIAKRGFDNENSPLGFVTKYISDRRGWSSPGMQGAESIFPLYLYNVTENNAQQTIGQKTERTPNLNLEIVNQLAERLGLTFTNEKDTSTGSVSDSSSVSASVSEPVELAPIDILDYIYAVLHSPTYREKYKEFLKIDFPRVPYPKDATTFWQLVNLGGEIRQIHLLESRIVEKYITQYPIDGDNKVGKVVFENGKVYINYEKDSPSGRLDGLQYFANVPETAWNFYIGGYQPAQKWLKDRKGRTLEFNDILHYQKIIVALTETDRIMKEIDSIEI